MCLSGGQSILGPFASIGEGTRVRSGKRPAGENADSIRKRVSIPSWKGLEKDFNVNPAASRRIGRSP